MLLRHYRTIAPIALAYLLVVVTTSSSQTPRGGTNGYLFNDSHFHLTNYIQEGPPIEQVLKIMSNVTGRSTLFGIPLQQEWSYRISAEDAPTYYLHTDAPLYYYSFTDAYIATVYNSLSEQDRNRFDPMITGFNPADMYAADHIRRVLQTFPGVFSGIGEFTIHKEFVSSKVAGGVASLIDPALDRVLNFAEEAGLVVLLHNDMDIPFPDIDKPPAYLGQMTALLKRHPRTTIIWAHTGVGRVVRPVKHHAEVLETMLTDPELSHVMFDISWDEVAKYLVSSPDTLKVASDLFNRHPDRFLFGTDVVAPKSVEHYTRTYHAYDTLWPLLSRDASFNIRKGNYERIFDEARTKVRAWEAGQALTLVQSQ